MESTNYGRNVKGMRLNEWPPIPAPHNEFVNCLCWLLSVHRVLRHGEGHGVGARTRPVFRHPRPPHRHWDISRFTSYPLESPQLLGPSLHQPSIIDNSFTFQSSQDFGIGKENGLGHEAEKRPFLSSDIGKSVFLLSSLDARLPSPPLVLLILH